MKYLIIITMLLIPVSGFAFSSSDFNKQLQETRRAKEAVEKAEAEKAQIKAEADEKEARDTRNQALKAAADAKTAEEEALKTKFGKGYANTIFAINNLRQSLYDNGDVYNVMSLVSKCYGLISGGMRTMEARVICNSGVEQKLKQYGNSTANINTNSANIIVGNISVEFVNGELLRYSTKGDNGIEETVTWKADKEYVTEKMNYGQYSLIANINLKHPNKTRFTEVNLPMSAQSTLVQIYNKRGITLTENAIIQMITDYYRNKLVPQGETLQNLMAGLLTDADVRGGFLQYCQEVAAPVKKANSNVKAVEFQ